MSRKEVNLVGLPLVYPEIVDEIVEFAGIPRGEVEYRVWMEALQPGWNVSRDVTQLGVTPHRYDEKMLKLYMDGEGFIFETLVFWARPDRRSWSQQAVERIEDYRRRSGLERGEVRIFVLGDGTGNDSLLLAQHGFYVDYFDVPGSRTFDFAVKRFENRGMLGDRIRKVDDYSRSVDRSYDVVLCFDVLEHLPDPVTYIRDISGMLKRGGIAVITEDFGDISTNLPTHLLATTYLAGRIPFTFLKHSMRLSWYSRGTLFRPSEFAKVEKTTRLDWLRLVLDGNVRGRYLWSRAGRVLGLMQSLAYLGAVHG